MAAANSNKPSDYIFPQEFALLTGLSLKTVYRRVKDGSLPCEQFGGKRNRILILKSALKLFSSTTQPLIITKLPDDKQTAISLQHKPHNGPRPKWMKKHA